MAIITKKYKFCAAHKYNNINWSKEKNVKVFGDDWKIHGHNYTLEISLKGPIDKDTGFVIDLKYFNELVQTEVINILDHSHIENDILWFKNKMPSSENLTVYIWEILNNKIKLPVKLDRIKIKETPTISAEYYGDGDIDG